MIIATAGHVDHGKTSLVRALTGVETDRLAEEKRRGLTIELGFAYLPLAEAGRIAGFVDVPGHERFVGTMVSGVGGIDAALLVVAADDGPMPQTDEHLAILDLLDVDEIVVVVSKVDLVTADRLATVMEAVKERLARLGRPARAVIATSVETGEGLAELRRAIEALPRRARAAGRAFRLAVDRSFVLDGVGLVATGTARAGTVTVGDELVVSPAGLPVRVRAVHAQGREVEQATAGARIALHLAGRHARRDEVTRGDWVVGPGAHLATTRLDVRIRLAPEADRALARETPVHVHHGAADVIGRCVLLADRRLEPGTMESALESALEGTWESAWAQVVLDRPIHAAFGDRLVLRDQSARRTLAGGIVVAAEGAARGRARPERLAALDALREVDDAVALTRLLELSPVPVDLPAFARSRGLDDAAVAALRDAVATVPVSRSLVLSARRHQAMREAILAALADTHARSPELAGLEATALRAVLPDRPRPAVIEAVARALVASADLERGPGGYHLPGHVARLSDADEATWAAIEPLFTAAAPSAPVLHEIAKALGRPAGEVAAAMGRLARAGRLVQVGRNRFLPPALLDRFVEVARNLDAGQGFDVAGFRDAAGIGRNLAIPVLEFLDRRDVTRRVGDLRRAPRADAAAGIDGD